MLNQQNMDGQDEESSLTKYQDIIETMSGINYIIDRNYRITVYSKEKWDDFAESNEGTELTQSDSVKGKSILENFAGNKVKEHYKQIYDLIFEGKRKEITIRAKCDAPEVLRDNVIYLSPIYANNKTKDEVIGILHQSLMIKVEEREKPAAILKKEKINNMDGRFLEMCSICKFVSYDPQNGNGKGWISSDEYYKLGGTDDIKLEHSICEDCSIMLNEFL